MGKGFIKIVKIIINGILDIVFPVEQNCISCFEEGFIGLCPVCFKKIKRFTSEGNIFSYGYYIGPLKDLILAFKYKENYLAGEIIANALCEVIEENNLKFDMVLYIPLSKKSMKKRGFNQCEILARKVCEKYNISISKNLIKIRETKEQKLLSREERRENIINVFDIKNGKEIEKKNIILIDDVITTGATVLECEKVLKKYGAKTVKILTVAQSFK